MADEINPRTGKPYSKKPRAVSARRKSNQKKSNTANQSEKERELQRQREEWQSIIDAGKVPPDYTGEQVYTDDKKKKLTIKDKPIDLGELREKGYNDDDAITTLEMEGMSPEMQKSYERNKGNPDFNREMEAYRKAKDKGNLTDEDRIRILNRNKDLLQISKLEQMRRVFGPLVDTGRSALAIVKGVSGFYKTLSGLK